AGFSLGRQQAVHGADGAVILPFIEQGGIDGSGPWQPAITGLPTIMPPGTSCKITDFSSGPGKGSIVIDPNNSKRLLIAIHNSVFDQTGGDPNASLSFGGNGWRDIGTNLGLSGW